MREEENTCVISKTNKMHGEVMTLRYNSGPRIETYGTPHRISFTLDEAPEHEICCCL